MPLHLPTPNEGSYEDPPPGLHPAVCIRLIDLGTQPSEFGGQPKPPDRKIRFTFEVHCDERMSDGRCYTINTMEMTLSTNKKANFRKMLESWRGRAFDERDFGDGGFDVKKVVGAPCMLNLVLKKDKAGKDRIRIDGVMKIPKNIPRPKPENELICFILEESEFNPALLEKFGQATQDKIKASPEYKHLANASTRALDQDPDPFDDDDDFGPGQAVAPAAAQPQRAAQPSAAQSPAAHQRQPGQTNSQAAIAASRIAQAPPARTPTAEILDDEIPF